MLEGKYINSFWTIFTPLCYEKRISKKSWRERCLACQINLHVCQKQKTKNTCFEDESDWNMYLLIFAK